MWVDPQITEILAINRDKKNLPVFLPALHLNFVCTVVEVSKIISQNPVQYFSVAVLIPKGFVNICQNYQIFCGH